MRRSPPFLLTALVLLLGAALTAGLVVFEGVTVRSLESQAEVEQGLRAQRLSSQLETELAASRQLASTAAALVAPLRQRSDVEALIQEMLASSSADYVYGIGVWFEPYQLEPERRFVGPYVHRDRERYPSERFVLTYEWSTSTYDYLSKPWYQQGVAGHGAVVFTEPYFDEDFVYRSLAQAFYNGDGTLRGVVSVDVILPQLRDVVMRANVSPDETLYVVTRGGRLFAHPDEDRLLAWARDTGRLSATGHLSELTLADLRQYEHAQGLDRQRYTHASPVSGPDWTVYVSTDTRSLFASAQRVRAATLVAGLVLWCMLLAGGVSVRHAFELRELSRALRARQRFQDALVRSERSLREVLETTSDGVVAVNASACIADWNASAERMFGWSRAEVLDRRAVEVLVPPEDRSLRQAEFDHLLGSGLPTIGSDRLELTALRRDGERFPAEVSLTAVNSNDDRQLFLFLHDITEQVEFDRLRDEFIRMTAHELRTPITVMKSFTQQALRTESGRAPALRRLLEGINRGVTRIDRVVGTLLDVSELHLRRMHLLREELDLREVVEETTRRLAAEHRDHPVRVSTQGEFPLRGDRQRLKQVLTTLLDNAFRYSPPLADVEVELRVEGSEAELAVRDHGIGIPSNRQRLLFERFYRPHSGTPHDTGGLGVGLYVAREIIRQHGGRILLESQEGKGTTVRVRLPLHRPHANGEAHPPRPEGHAPPAGLEAP